MAPNVSPELIMTSLAMVAESPLLAIILIALVVIAIVVAYNLVGE